MPSLRIEGPATIRTAAEIRDRLIAFLAEGAELRIDCSGIDEVDITLLQLLTAAARSAAAAGKAVLLDPPPPECLLDLAERAGFALPSTLSAEP